MTLFIGEREITPTIITQGGGSTISATNLTGNLISEGDKVWINQDGNTYNIVSYTEDTFNIASSDMKSIKSLSRYFTPSTTKYFSIGSNSIDNYSGNIAYGNYDYAWVVKFKTPTTIGELYRIFGTGESLSEYGLWCDFTRLGYATAGIALTDGWVTLEGHTVLQTDTWYWVKVSRDYTNNIYKVELSTDGSSWNTETTLNNSNHAFNQHNEYLLLSQVDGTYSALKYDLAGCSYTSNYNNINWKALDLGNISEKTITGIASENITVNAVGLVKTIL